MITVITLQTDDHFNTFITIILSNIIITIVFLVYCFLSIQIPQTLYKLKVDYHF